MIKCAPFIISSVHCPFANCLAECAGVKKFSRALTIKLTNYMRAATSVGGTKKRFQLSNMVELIFLPHHIAKFMGKSKNPLVILCVCDFHCAGVILNQFVQIESLQKKIGKYKLHESNLLITFGKKR